MRPRLLSVAALSLVVVHLAAPPGTQGQQPAKVFSRVGVLSELGMPSERESRVGAAAGVGPTTVLAPALRELGWIEGKNLLMESRFAEGYVKRLPGLAGDLVRLKVDLIVAVGNHAIAAARQATTSIPIVMMVAADPVGSQFVKSLARPGGNVTGTTIYSPQVAGKLVEVLKGALPDARDVSVILEPDLPGMPAYIREGNVAAKTLGLRVRYLEVRDTSGLDAALAQVHRQRPDALYVVPSGTVGAQYRRIIRFAMKEKLPTFWPAGVGFAHAGGLVTYGPNRDDMMQRTAAIVDKLLKGAHAADVPVEQRSRFDLAINLRTARALGLTIPPSILVRATHIIE